jgi:hypothetical protein
MSTGLPRLASISGVKISNRRLINVEVVKVGSLFGASSS